MPWNSQDKNISKLLNRLILTGLVILAINGCGFFREPGKSRCDKILKREQLTEILTDVYLLEGFLMEQQSYYTYSIDSAKFYYAALFERHGVSRETFEAALACYLQDEADMRLIHDHILEKLSLLESQARKPRELSDDETPDSPEETEATPEGDETIPDVSLQETAVEPDGLKPH